jgi:hypothetical protein
MSEYKEHEGSEEKEKVWEQTLFIEKGINVLDSKYHQSWAKCVPIRLNDLYRGKDLQACLDIVNQLNNGCSLEEAKVVMKSQGHSGASFHLVSSMIRSFCDRGRDFVEYVNCKPNF